MGNILQVLQERSLDSYNLCQMAYEVRNAFKH